MTPQTPTPPSRGLLILRTILYILAGIVLAAGLIVGIALIASAGSTVESLIMPLLLIGGGAVANLLRPVLSGFLINLGIITLILSLVISALLFAVARLVHHTANLEARIAALEARA